VLGVLQGAASSVELSEAGAADILESVRDLPAWLSRREGLCP